MDTKWIEIVQKLMAKAENAATSVEERNAIVEKMTFLMAKHGIEEAMLNAGKPEAESVISVRFEMKAPYVNPKLILLNAVSQIFGAKPVLVEHANRRNSTPNSKNVLRIFGFPGDLEKIMMLNGSLTIQMLTELAGAEKPDHVHGKAFNNSFVNGYVNTVIKRVDAAYSKARQDVSDSTTGSSMELVLQTRSTAVNAQFTNAYPNTNSTNISSRSSSGVGYSAGQSAGRNANIGQTGLGGRRALGN